MDSKTIETYNKEAQAISERHKAAKPERLYTLAQTFFKKGATTIDLGCGMGRDTNWLNQNGYPTVGYDASIGMLQEAKKYYPNLEFKTATLPDLIIPEATFENLFCCAVLMHVPRSDLLSAVENILNAVKPKGHIVLSYRSGAGENDGRLFETYHPEQIAQLFESLGSKVILTETEGTWHNLVIEKGILNDSTR
jgi:2-polyprenyl-3-methyl-5-hydroxy-6-metoxy-1,4-benzoquinol methylase